jgi:L-alanine-DL-glutamate epimerase-like enolase superfamily enzyme
MTASVRLASIRWRPFRLPLRHRFEAAHSVLAAREGVLLEVRGDDQATGVGEASPFPALGDGTVGDVLGLLAVHSEAILAAPEQALTALDVRRPGVAALRCAIDTALLDLEGQRRGLPVARLIASSDPMGRGAWFRLRESVAVNAVIGGGAPGEVAQYGVEATAAGYSTLKVKVGVGDVDADVDRIAALRASCSHATIRLDANGAWTEQQAREALMRLAPLRIELIEQPVAPDDLRGMARLRAQGLPQSAYAAPDGGGLRGLVGIPIGADEPVVSEHTALAVLAARAADVLVLKPMRLGGLRPALAIAQRAAQEGVGSIITTTFDSSIGTAVALHLAAVVGTTAAHGLSTGEHLDADIVSVPLLPIQGRMTLPVMPGLGVTVDTQRLEELATGPWVERDAGAGMRPA